jgi:phage terminase large subunit-like protein
LAGFVSVDKEAGNKNRKLDETAIAIVKVHQEGWWVKEIRHGRWDIQETCREIFKAVQNYMPSKIGIEKGSLKNAAAPYLNDLMRENNMYFRIEDLNHGNRRKSERIIWSLQGLFENGKIVLERGDWNTPFLDQLVNFPNRQLHDDLVDALAYIQQIAQVEMSFEDIEEEYEALDMVSGY